MLAILGVLVPLLIVNSSSNRVDKAIQEMKQEFKELAGEQQRQPDLKFYLDGQEINRLTLEYFGGRLNIDVPIIYLKNDGDALASNVKARLYSLKLVVARGDNLWHYSDKSDEPGFDNIHYYELIDNIVLNPNESKEINFNMSFVFQSRNSFDLLLKVYSQREPIALRITVVNTPP